MKIKKVIHEISDTTNMNRIYLANVYFFKFFSLSIWLIIISICLSFVAKSVRAETGDSGLYYRYVPYEGPKSTTGTADQPAKQSSGASDTEAKKASPAEPAKKTEESAGQESKEPSAATGGGGQAPALAKEQKAECPHKSVTKVPPVGRPEKDTGEFPSGEFPSFCKVDVNGDHYITKDELQNFPELLRVFDKVDAGKDGKLEQHEFQNLEMETTREGEVS